MLQIIKMAWYRSRGVLIEAKKDISRDLINILNEGLKSLLFLVYSSITGFCENLKYLIVLICIFFEDPFPKKSQKTKIDNLEFPVFSSQIRTISVQDFHRNQSVAN